MKVSDRFFPRVWDGEKYFYPVFSELGVTYENESLPLTDENIKSLDWALGWHFHPDSKNTFLEFDSVLEACTGLRDKNGKLIYEGDIIRVEDNYCSVSWDNENARYEVSGYGEIAYLNYYDIEVIGNIHEKP